MKLGSETGSVVNHLLSRGVIGQPYPKAGMGATLLMWTDRLPATIVNVYETVQSHKGAARYWTWVEVREDDYVRTDRNGLSEDQSYTFTPNPAGRMRTFRAMRGGLWEEVRRNPDTGRWNKVDGGGLGLRIGERNRYYDPSF